MIKEKGGVNSDAFIEFLKRLMVGSKNKIFLIVDNGPAHVSKKTKAFVAKLGARFVLSLAIFAGQKPGRTGLEASQSRYCRVDDDNELQ
jgi:hypothetical protein